MRTAIVRPSDLGPAELARWGDIQQTHPDLANPFLSPTFAVRVAQGRGQTRVAVFEEDGIVGFLPFEKRAPGVKAALAVGLTDAQAVIVSPETPFDLSRAMGRGGLEVWLFDHLVGHQAALLGGRGRYVEHSSPVLDLSRGYDAYVAEQRLRSKTLFSLNERRRRQLERDLGPLRFVWDSTDSAMLAKVLSWKSEQYRQTGARDRFANPHIRALVHDLLDVSDPGCRGSLSYVLAGDVMVAGHFGLRSESVLSYWFPAYDSQYARYSPGMILLLEMASAAAAAGIDRFDLGKGDDAYKARVRSSDLTILSGYTTARRSSRPAYGLIAAPREQALRVLVDSPALRDRARTGLRRLEEVRAGAKRVAANLSVPRPRRSPQP